MCLVRYLRMNRFCFLQGQQLLQQQRMPLQVQQASWHQAQGHTQMVQRLCSVHQLQVQTSQHLQWLQLWGRCLNPMALQLQERRSL